MIINGRLLEGSLVDSCKTTYFYWTLVKDSELNEEVSLINCNFTNIIKYARGVNIF